MESQLNPVSLATSEEHQPWVCAVENWSEIGKESAATLLSLAEKRLAETIVTAEGISKRSDRLLSIVIPLLTLALSYVFGNGVDKFGDNYLVTMACFSLVPLTMSLYHIIQNFLPYQIRVTGEEPKYVATPELFDTDLKEEHKYISLVLHQLSNYQLKIDKNLHTNKNRITHNEKALRLMICLPAITVIAYFLVLAEQFLGNV